MTDTHFDIKTIPAEAANELREGSSPVYVADSVPGYPCRQCLQDADIGEELILVSHDPFDGSSPYRSASPILLHREPCQPFAGHDLPIQLTRRCLSVRCFDAEEMMIEAAVVEGYCLRETLDEFLSSEGAAWVHIHNADRGCWLATAQRIR